MPRTKLFATLAVCLLCVSSAGADVPPAEFPRGPYQWTISPPLISPADRPADPCHAIKDPSVVFHNGKWHVFATIRSKTRTHQIEYLSFTDWSKANEAPRHVLTLRDAYFCAPQVFYFTPHNKWYLLYQVGEPNRKPQLQPAVSTTDNLADPASWSKPTLLFDQGPEGVKSWIDFWIICDATHARLFFTSNDGHMWRSDTRLADFPKGWSKPQVVLKTDIFEASHTYRVKAREQYITIIEAQADGRRYYKAYEAKTLDGEWKPLADSKQNPFAGLANITPQTGQPKWTDNISHGELLRVGVDEQLEIDPTNLRFLFQGVSDEEKKGKPYGQIPWRLGILELKHAQASNP